MGKRRKNKGAAVRSKTSQEQINVVKKINLGHIPLFVQLAHKGLEKAAPAGAKADSGEVTFTVPKDILGIAISDPKLVEAVESLEFVYKKGA